jgi:hypothetical protein
MSIAASCLSDSLPATQQCVLAAASHRPPCALFRALAPRSQHPAVFQAVSRHSGRPISNLVNFCISPLSSPVAIVAFRRGCCFAPVVAALLDSNTIASRPT